MPEETEESPFKCPKCGSYYPGKVFVYDFKDEEYLRGNKKEPRKIQTICHGVHPKDPWE